MIFLLYVAIQNKKPILFESKLESDVFKECVSNKNSVYKRHFTYSGIPIKELIHVYETCQTKSDHESEMIIKIIKAHIEQELTSRGFNCSYLNKENLKKVIRISIYCKSDLC